MLVTSEHLNYLQRIGLNNDTTQLTQQNSAAKPVFKKLMKVKSYGQFSKNIPDPSVDLPSTDILCGLYGDRIPVAFLITGSSSSTDIFIGTWSTNANNELDQRAEVIKSSLESGYASVTYGNDQPDSNYFNTFSRAGLVMGVPTVKLPQKGEMSLPIERLMRAMKGLNWGALILAQPVSQTQTNELRLSAIDEMKRVTQGSPQNDSPLGSYYIETLQNTVSSMTYALMSGNWRTGVYLLGDEKSYSQLAGAWTGIYSGEDSFPDSISLLQSETILDLAKSWKLPDVTEINGPGRYQHPLKYQTLLNSRQLSAYIHFPQKETSGFSIEIVPNFDAVPPKIVSNKTIKIGEIIHQSKPTHNKYEIDLNKLNSHIFVSGITGCGKTNTIFGLLDQVTDFEIPFLVIEPAKTEYRALLNNPKFKDKLQIFTPGNEKISPFRLNPFEVVCCGDKVSVSRHIDLLRSVFTASFGMWEPLPQILEQCLYLIYEDKGWDITTNHNSRLDKGSDIRLSFPTMSDLAEKVDTVLQSSGYDDKITSDMRSALLTRLNSLRIGGKGRMLDVTYSLPMELILKRPTVLELDEMGDEDDKAFIMGLLFIRLVEYRIAEEEKKDLQHLLVIEEAHRLLTNVGAKGSEEGNPRGKAVETFSNLISEIRAYGQGIIIVDQVPVKLAPDVIKNTATKIIHRCVSLEDRIVLAGATGMNDIQSNSITTFVNGQAAVSSEGDDTPILVAIDRSPYHNDAPAHDVVKKLMSNWAVSVSYDPTVEPVQEFTKIDNPKWISLSKNLAQSPPFQEKIDLMILSIVEDDDTMDSLFQNLLGYIREILTEGMTFLTICEAVLFSAAEYNAAERGNSNNWPYSKTKEFEVALRNLFFANVTNKKVNECLSVFRKCAFELYKRSFEPYIGCSKICKQEVCLYRKNVDRYIKSSKEDLSYAFDSAYGEDSSENNQLKTTLELCHKTAHEITHLDVSQSVATERVTLCLVQHFLKDKSLAAHDMVLDDLIKAIKNK